jgi:phenylpropionate dioxygenase-like ring-hydroxylating dioxygenase large terminal subunit
MTTTSDIDTGTGYGRSEGTHNARLTEVGPGTPMGEALRRYWHPIASSDTLVAGALPEKTRVLGEDLVVFRDGQGNPGVVVERCAHRGASLYFGRVEEDGIRCCYHGWKFDVKGNCVEQACEPGLGLKRDAVRQAWYPVEERYGLVFAYMGPPEHKPALPRYDALEDLEEGEQYYASWPVPFVAAITGMPSDYNWLQNYENAADPTHVTWLHSAHSGFQMLGTGTFGYPEQFFDSTTIADRINYIRTDRGVKYIHRFEHANEGGELAEMGFMVECLVPNVFGLPDYTIVNPDQRHDHMMWVVPTDDTAHRIFFSIRTSDPERVKRFAFGIMQEGKQNFELSDDERHRTPGDAEAQGSQGPITLHSTETLATADRGVVMLRRMLLVMVDDVEAGRDPINVSHEETVTHVDSGVVTMVTVPGEKLSVPASTVATTAGA